MSKVIELIDPRQIKTLEAYKNPQSPTFSNLYQSALQSGYPESYARNISEVRPQWLTDNIENDVSLIQVAEKNLKKYASMTIDLDSSKGTDLARIQTDVSKFILKTLAKQKYSEDIKDKAPTQVQVNIVRYDKDIKDIEVSETKDIASSA